MISNNKLRMHIGLDDTDSSRGGCTTYITSLIVEKLERLGCTFVDYPLLIRLNPNVPWKTRGNGALCLRIEYDESIETKIKETVLELVEEHSDITWKGTDPGIVFLKGRNIPQELSCFADKTEKQLVTIKEALHVIKKFKAEAFAYNSQLGLVGALAAVGETLPNDHTYELLAYRKPENVGTKRQIIEESVFRMDEKLKPLTFNNVDTEKRRVIITPRGPDPILLGVRGENAQVVREAFKLIEVLEPVERWVIFRSNQGTDAHFKRISSIKEANPASSVVVTGTVSREPKIVPIRHVVFGLKDEAGEIDCIAYEPTGALRKVAQKLKIGDHVEVYGAVKSFGSREKGNVTINLEKINILNLVPNLRFLNPKCPSCEKQLKSMGKGQGYRCEKCKNRFSNLEKVCFYQERALKTGLYVTSVRSQRHLTKPLRRYGQEKRKGIVEPIIEGWHSS